MPDYGAKYAAIMLSIIPVVVVYFIFSRFIVEGVALGGVKSIIHTMYDFIKSSQLWLLFFIV